jgi:hypothetical protein
MGWLRIRVRVQGKLQAQIQRLCRRSKGGLTKDLRVRA